MQAHPTSLHDAIYLYSKVSFIHWLIWYWFLQRMCKVWGVKRRHPVYSPEGTHQMNTVITENNNKVNLIPNWLEASSSSNSLLNLHGDHVETTTQAQACYWAPPLSSLMTHDYFLNQEFISIIVVSLHHSLKGNQLRGIDVYSWARSSFERLNLTQRASPGLTFVHRFKPNAPHL